MLIGGDDISNDVITFGTCFLVFFNVCLHLRSFPLCADWRNLADQSDGKPQGNWRESRESKSLQALLPFPASPPERPGELARRPGAILLETGKGSNTVT